MDLNKAIKLAAKGDKSALKQLYSHHAGEVYYLCSYFLKGGSAAAEATVQVFKEVFAETVGQPVLNPQLFSALVLGKTAAVCKGVLQKNSPAAFRDAEKQVPDATYTAVQNISAPTAEEKENLTKALRSLQNRQCFVFTLLYCFDMPKHQLAKHMKLDHDKLVASFARAKDSLRKTLKISETNRRDLEDNLRILKTVMTENAAAATAPQEVEKQVFSHIEKVSKTLTVTTVKRIGLVFLCCAVAVGLVFGGTYIFKGKSSSDTDSQTDTAVSATNAEEPEFKATKHAEIEIKNYGTVALELYGEEAPISVNNFVKLANDGFYNGLTFHRIISGFMIQGGDPNGNGTGGSSETIKGEFSENGVQNRILHTRGTISMARSSENDSASSQFFIMHQDTDSLNGSYAAFGRVTSGMEIVDKICEDTPVTDSNGTVEAANQPVITAVRITD